MYINTTYKHPTYIDYTRAETSCVYHTNNRLYSSPSSSPVQRHRVPLPVYAPPLCV